MDSILVFSHAVHRESKATVNLQPEHVRIYRKWKEGGPCVRPLAFLFTSPENLFLFLTLTHLETGEGAVNEYYDTETKGLAS